MSASAPKPSTTFATTVATCMPMLNDSPAGRRRRRRAARGVARPEGDRRLLGTSVGGLIILTNVRTFFDYAGTSGELRWPVYLALVAVWVTAITWVVRAHRREGLPILNGKRSKPELATEPAR